MRICKIVKSEGEKPSDYFMQLRLSLKTVGVYGRIYKVFRLIVSRDGVNGPFLVAPN